MKLPQQSDQQLVILIAEGQTEALGELVRRHQSRVYQLAYRTTGNASLAEDITQDVFLRVWRNAGSYTPDAKLTTWLHRITVNLCLDSIRKNKRRGEVTVDAIPEREAPPPEKYESDSREAVIAAVQALSERQRIALLLHRLGGCPLKEVSEITGWSESAVESLLTRAYANLRERLAVYRK